MVCASRAGHTHLLDDAGQVSNIHDQVVVLGDGTCDLHNGCLLEAISADQLARHLRSVTDLCDAS